MQQGRRETVRQREGEKEERPVEKPPPTNRLTTRGMGVSSKPGIDKNSRAWEGSRELP